MFSLKRVQRGKGYTFYDIIRDGDGVLIERHAKESDSDLLVDVKARAEKALAYYNQCAGMLNEDAAAKALARTDRVEV